MSASERPICVSWRCSRRLVCLMHYCHHTWAEIVDAKASGRTIHLRGTGEGCTDYTEDFASARETRAMPLLGVGRG